METKSASFFDLLSTRTALILLKAGVRSYDDFKEAVNNKVPFKRIGKVFVNEINGVLSEISPETKVMLFEKKEVDGVAAWTLCFSRDNSDEWPRNGYSMSLKFKVPAGRDIEIFRLREEGKTYSEIAERYGISTSRARQIYNRVQRIRQHQALVCCLRCKHYSSERYYCGLFRLNDMREKDFCSRWEESRESELQRFPWMRERDQNA